MQQTTLLAAAGVLAIVAGIAIHRGQRVPPEAFRLLKDAIRVARRRYFAVNRGESVQLVAEAPPDEVVTELAVRHFTPQWPLAYHYEGEDYNLVRPGFHLGNRTDTPYRQVHVRLFVDEFPDGEIGIAAHEEASAIVHPAAHLAERTYTEAEGKRVVKAILDHAGIEYREAES